MAMICDKCDGVIPDVMVGGKDRHDCKNHGHPDVDWHTKRKLY